MGRKSKSPRLTNADLEAFERFCRGEEKKSFPKDSTYWAHTPRMKRHPVAEAFPGMKESQFKLLVEDVTKNGPREPIYTFDGMILDGWDLYQACSIASVTPHFKEYTEGDPHDFFVSRNMRRKHYSVVQKAMALFKLCDAKSGDNQRSPTGLTTQKKLARDYNIPHRAVRRAGVIQTKGVDELKALVLNERIKLSRGEAIARLDPASQSQAIADLMKPKRKKVSEPAAASCLFEEPRIHKLGLSLSRTEKGLLNSAASKMAGATVEEFARAKLVSALHHEEAAIEDDSETLAATSNKHTQHKSEIKKFKYPKIEISAPIIDRLAFIVTVPSIEDAEQARASLLNSTSTKEMNFKVFKNFPEYLEVGFSTKEIPDHGDDDELRAMVHISVMKQSIRVEYNPAKLCDRFYDFLNALVPKFTSYETFDALLSFGKITRMDIARDIRGMNIGDYVFEGYRFRTHTNSFGTDWELGSIYLGCTEGERCVFYNKKKELERFGQCEGEETRVEYRHKPSVRLGELLKWHCPFERVRIFQVDAVHLSSIPEQYRGWFMHACRAIGIANALKSAGFQVESEVSRKTFKAFSDGCLPLWRASHKTWEKDWVDALRKYRLFDAVLRDAENIA